MDKPPSLTSPTPAPVASRFPRIRKRICEACQAQCEAFKAGHLDYTDPEASCPIHRWSNQHGVVYFFGTSGTVTHTFKASEAATWRELHTYQPTGDLSQDEAWLNDFSHRVPRINCQCRRHWHDFLASNPPDWVNWFAWTVEAHNSVNRRLQKPEMNVAEALKIWKIELSAPDSMAKVVDSKINVD